MSAFNLHDYEVIADETDGSLLHCMRPAGPSCHDLERRCPGPHLADLVAAAQAHHEQHHRAPHLMDRQVTT